MTDFERTIEDTKLLVFKAQWHLEQMIENNERMIQLSEEFTAICDDFLDRTDESGTFGKEINASLEDF